VPTDGVKACSRLRRTAPPADPERLVALDGVLLTVNDVAGNDFTVLIISHTLTVTTFGTLARGDRVNLEVDLMARHAARLIEARQ
jgi:riboflavin synthase